MRPDRENLEPPMVNSAYATFQLAKALQTSETHRDPATRARAREKVTRWIEVLSGLENGSLDVGSRTPIDDAPAWVTLSVVTGGFATGAFAAAGKIQNHELLLLEQIGVAAPESDVRLTLNTYFLSEEGLAHLQQLLQSGRYEIQVPEEGALLVVAWLLAHGNVSAAHQLLKTLGPFFARLRFYPVPTERPSRLSSRVFLANVKEIRAKLAALKPHAQLTQFREAVLVWRPLYDRLVALFLETIAGDIPTVKPSFDGPAEIRGGWPCRNYPSNWQLRTADWLAEFDRLGKEHRLTKKPVRKKEHFAQLVALARKCAKDPRTLTGCEVGRIRMILAHHLAKHGTPDSEGLRTQRDEQAKLARRPLYADVASLVAQRMKGLPANEGLDDPASVTFPVVEHESQSAGIPTDTLIPEAICRRVERALCDTVEALIERGLITSGDVVARLLPQITALRRSGEIPDPELRRLYAGIYQAFRRRRSLLLLNLETQVKLEELPWIAVVDDFRQRDDSFVQAARAALVEVVVQVISAFPQAILPNKLLQELRALVKDSQLDLPLVDELASDIFMGEFSNKFTLAAKQAAEFTAESLYARYYHIDAEAIGGLPLVAEKTPAVLAWFRQLASPTNAFATLCAARAGVKLGTWRPATNGQIIEQQQILTTHNLAMLIGRLELLPHIAERLPGMAQKCFSWIVDRLNVESESYHVRLVTIKNAAYAWRQMIFYLSYIPQPDLDAFLTWADTVLSERPQPFRDKFRPVMRGLTLAASGLSLDHPTAGRMDARQFLGWSGSGHWLA